MCLASESVVLLSAASANAQRVASHGSLAFRVLARNSVIKCTLPFQIPDSESLLVLFLSLCDFVLYIITLASKFGRLKIWDRPSD